MPTFSARELSDRAVPCSGTALLPSLNDSALQFYDSLVKVRRRTSADAQFLVTVMLRLQFYPYCCVSLVSEGCNVTIWRQLPMLLNEERLHPPVPNYRGAILLERSFRILVDILKFVDRLLSRRYYMSFNICGKNRYNARTNIWMHTLYLDNGTNSNPPYLQTFTPLFFDIYNLILSRGRRKYNSLQYGRTCDGEAAP